MKIREFRNRKAFIPFVTAGHPDLESTREIVIRLAEAGAQVIEIGIPFSDPIADGPVIQRASFAALRHGYGISDYIQLVREIRAQTEAGLLFMTYLNPVLQFGLSRLDQEASAAGLNGILVSDLTPEEYRAIAATDPDHGARFQRLDTVFLVAPTSSEERIRIACEEATGFVYLLARTGVTGQTTRLDPSLSRIVGQIRESTDLPVAVGFGISSRKDVLRVWEIADGAIVGSAIVRFIDEHQGLPDLPTRVAQYVTSELMP